MIEPDHEKPAIAQAMPDPQDQAVELFLRRRQAGRGGRRRGPNSLSSAGQTVLRVSVTREHRHLSRKRIRGIMRRSWTACGVSGRNAQVRAAKGHKKYPYLLRGKEIRYPNQVCGRLTSVRLPSGHGYLVVILDLFSRWVLEAPGRRTRRMLRFCIEALEEAIERYGEPAIFNTDQGSQFAGDAFVGILENHGIRISMDGKGRALDNVYVERLWRSLKYEDIYLHSYQTMGELREGIDRYFRFYNCERFHQSLEYLTPEEMHRSFVSENALQSAA